MKKEEAKKLYTFDLDAGHVAPQSVGLEKAVLGALMLESEAFDTIAGLLSPEMFYRSEHRTIFEAISSLAAGHKPVDMLTVTERLMAGRNLENAGGQSYISELTADIAGTSHLEAHAGILRDKYVRRKIIETCMRLAAGGYDESEDIHALMAGSGAAFDSLQELLAGQNSMAHLSEVMKESVKEAFRRMDMAKRNERPGIPTGFADLDRITGGWQAGNLIVIAGRPGNCKTGLSLHMTERAAFNGKKVVFFSLEMNRREIGDRMIVGRSGVDKDGYRAGTITPADMLAVENAAFGTLYSLPVHIEDKPRQTVGELTARMRVMKKRGQCDMAVIDYLQLIRSGIRGRSRDEEVGDITREMKIAAKELGIPVILLSQMNREVEKRSSREPVLSDLRESGSIEQDADIVIFIQRLGADGETQTVDAITGQKDIIRLFVRKNRDGRQGIVKITHNLSLTAFYDYDRSQPLPSAGAGQTRNFYEPDKETLPF